MANKRISITLNEKVEKELEEIMKRYGFATMSQAASYAIATWVDQHDSAEYWQQYVTKVVGNHSSSR